jgi:hypothetical protein
MAAVHAAAIPIPDFMVISLVACRAVLRRLAV